MGVFLPGVDPDPLYSASAPVVLLYHPSLLALYALALCLFAAWACWEIDHAEECPR